jgi:chorismate mutase
MVDPDRHSGADDERPSPEAKRRVMRAALLHPWGLLMIVIGVVFFATTLTWWILPLTLATYAGFVFFTARDPTFRTRVLEGRRPGMRPELPHREQDLSPERRARWLSRGETRKRVEEALEIHRRTVSAIEASDDVTRAVLDDAIPKLQRVAERLVDVAQKREKVAEAIQDLNKSSHTSPANAKERREADLEELKRELHAVDAEISDTFEKLLSLRTRVVRVSLESGGAAQNAAAKLNTELDELNLRLDALHSTMLPEPPDR